MGICFSKKTSSSSSLVLEAPPPPPPPPISKPKPDPTTSISPPQQTPVSIPLISNSNNKKEIFFIKQRNSHERERRPEQDIHILPNSTTTTTKSSSSPTLSSSSPPPSAGIVAASAPVIRTSSCTKEEVDAILIQCGRLSRSSSGKNSSETARKYSGSKRSYDFDHDTCTTTDQQRHDKDNDKLYSPHRTRRTPSRETDLEYKRSSSNRHRSSSTSRDEDRKRNNQNQSGGRRLSRSPARRSETTTTTTTTTSSSSKGPGPGPGPAKMVSVPASTTGAIKRVSVKRTTASPRSQSPANAREPSLSLSRNSSSRKPDNSPYRRNPLTEIDDNVLRSQQINNNTTDQGIPTNKNFHSQSQSQSQKSDGGIGKQKSAAKNQNEPAFEAAKLQSSGVQVSPKAGDAGIEDLKLPQTTITRSRSSRRSRDLDFINDDALVNVPTSYASILLEDIQNFHHKNSNTTAPFSLPPCVAKACSILDAVADLNSSTNSNISSAFSEDRNSRTSNNNTTNNVSSFNVHLGKTRLDVVNKDPFVQETEVLVSDDLMEPSIHKYITVRRGMAEEMEQQESSGSNSIVGQQWFASSSWEPSSADSADHWTAGRDEGVVDKEEPRLLVGHKKAGFLEGSRKSRSSTLLTSAVTLSGKKREMDHQLSKVGAKTQTAPIAAAASM